MSPAPSARSACRLCCSWTRRTSIRLPRLLPSPTRHRINLFSYSTSSANSASSPSSVGWQEPVANRNGKAKTKQEKNAYASTLLLPHTQFPLRANAAQREPLYRARTTTELYRWQWETRRPCRQTERRNATDRARSDTAVEENRSHPLFVLHDGPPYANGPLHMGHAMNKVLKDIINRYRVLRGDRVHYAPGWDCHGLPIELKALAEIQQEGEGKKKGSQKSDEGTAATAANTSFSPLQVRQIARTKALQAIELQASQFSHLGIMADWNDRKATYRTLDLDYELTQMGLFAEMAKRGLISRARRPVYWSPSTHTALAEAELEYIPDYLSQSVYVRLPLSQIGDRLASGVPWLQADQDQQIDLVIWTTTPWSLPSNMAVAVNPNLDYSLVRMGEEQKLMIIGSERVEAIAALKPGMHVEPQQQKGKKDVKQVTHGPDQGRSHEQVQKRKSVGPAVVLAQFKGSVLLDSFYSPPFRSRQTGADQRRIISADYVTAETGTGLVHTAPAHGAEDYARMKELGMLQIEQPFSPVDDQGRYTDELANVFIQGRGEEIDAGTALVGQDVLAGGTRAVIALLESAGLLLSHAPQRHRYPCDWRSKQPVLVRATWQWFANLDEIQHAALDALEDVRFVPSASRIRLESFVKGRKEWCISRQRAWGLPIPVVYNDAAEAAGASTESTPLLESDNVDHIAKVLREHGGMDYWWVGEPEEFVLPRYREQFHNAKWRKGTDTIDVWFDSGSSWATICNDLLCEGEEQRAGDPNQPIADVYLEGSDQHRGWFQSSLLIKMATATAGSAPTAPYKNLLTHGMVVDKDGKKMSKSLGNIVSPLDFIHGAPKRQIPAYGTDVLRLWVARSDYTKDAPIGNEIITKASNALRKLRNTARFMLANLRGQGIAAFDSFPQLLLCERLVLHDLYHLERECVKAYDRFDFATVSRRLNEFATTTLSTFYLDVTKDSLYSDAAIDPRRQAVLATLDQILRTCTTLMAPIAPHLAEEVHQYRLTDAEASNDDDTSNGSVFQLGWQTVPAQFADPAISARGPLLADLKDRILTLLEACRKEQLIASAAEAEVWLSAREESELAATLREHVNDLSRYFTTSGVHLELVSASTALAWTKEDQHHGTTILIGPARLQKCPRCWLHTRKAHETLCKRCDIVVHGTGVHQGA